MSLPPAPRVHPWMVAPHGPVAGSAERLGVVAERVDSAGKTLQQVLGEAGGVLGWRSPGAQSARVPLVRADSEVGQLRDLVGRASRVVQSLSAVMAERGPELRRLVKERQALETKADGGTTGGGGTTSTDPQVAADARRVDTEMSEHIAALARADRTVRDELAAVGQLVAALGAMDREDEWVSDMAPPDVVDLLGKYGVTESAGDRGILDKVMLLPPGPEGDKELRAMLAAMPPDELADFLLRHPDVARRLQAPLGAPDSYPADSPEALLATAIAAGKSLPPKDRIAAIQAIFNRMSPEEQRRMALLYPDVVGNLDGAPLDLRMASNRVKIGIALDDERGKQFNHARSMAARSDPQKWWGDVNSKEGWRLAVDTDDADSDEYRNTKRIAYYQTLLYEEVTQPGGAPGKFGTYGATDERSRNPNADYSSTVHYDQHQVLYFDPTGDGQIAEMWGTLGPETRNVAVFVPGTTADLENFGSDSEKMRTMAEKDPTGQTVTITWLGTNMPDAVAANATNNKDAEEGGPKLRDFVWGLDIPPEKRVTAIGHSYGGGVVGVADREGLDVDAVVHLESAGTGQGVNSAADYPDGIDGKERYSMTAPGDLIAGVQGLASQGRRSGTAATRTRPPVSSASTPVASPRATTRGSWCTARSRTPTSPGPATPPTTTCSASSPAARSRRTWSR